METFRNITFIACFISIAMSMLDMITPEGKFKKQVRLIFALVFIIAIVNPILHGHFNFKLDDIVDIKETSEYLMVTDTFYNSLAENYSDNIEQVLNQKLLINEIKANEISVNVNISEDNCIDINEVKIVLAVRLKDKADKTKEIVKNEIGNYPIKITFTEEAL